MGLSVGAWALGLVCISIYLRHIYIYIYMDGYLQTLLSPPAAIIAHAVPCCFVVVLKCFGAGSYSWHEP